MTMTLMKMMKWILLIMVCLVLEVVSGNEEIRCIPKERQALLQFKASLVDDYGMLSSWNNGNVDCCQWEGILCDNLTGHVVSLDLHGEIHVERVFNHGYRISSERYIGGDMDKSLMELQQLQYLNLSYNHFQYRNIQHLFASLTNLRFLDLSNSDFDGNIPTQLGSLSHLKNLNLAGNYLEGSIPYQLGNLSNLQYLDLSHNSLQGKIPSQLGKLSNLQTLSLGGSDDLRIDYGNHMRGQWLSNLTSLTHLYLDSISDFHTSHSYLQIITKLPKLRELSLRDCSLSDHFILSLRPFKFNFSTSLSVLDLSYNTFTSSIILEWVSNITSNLVELDLSGNYLEGGSTSNHFATKMVILPKLTELRLKGCNLSDNFLHSITPSKINFSTSLSILDLSDNTFTSSKIFPWVSNLSSSLTELDLSANLLEGSVSSDHFGIMMNSLERLDLSYNSLNGGVLNSFLNICTLHSLYMSHNDLTEDLPTIFDNLSGGCVKYSLQELDLSYNHIIGSLPNSSVFSSLKMLDLSYNRLSGKIHNGIRLPSQLRSLDLSNNSLCGELPMIIHHLSTYAKYSLKELDLSMNQINGTLPNLLVMFPSLKVLRLYGNKLNGTISKDLQFPAGLEQLDLSSNLLKGVITDSHFLNMSDLLSLDLSDNSLTLAFPQNWIPPFQLRHIGLRSCKLGPTFPMWLQMQNNFDQLDISSNGISDVVPKWFWAKFGTQDCHIVDISYNNLSGIIPNFPLKNILFYLALESNQFEGPIPSFLRGVEFLNLSKNKFSNSHSFLCANVTIENLLLLDLSTNQLSGQIPDCWSHFRSLIYLDLSHNTFSGNIPTSMGSLRDLQALLLRNNNLTKDISLSLRNCTELVMLDMTENTLSGPIPAWIGNKLQKLEILSLGRNHFLGSLPLQICDLKRIHILDLSQNNLSGKIFKCIKNFTSMYQKTSSKDYQGPRYSFESDSYSISRLYNLNAFLMWKGSKQMFKNKELSLLKSIDLSSNHFSGEIPIEIENLLELVSLNLSRNNLTGKIPVNIGKLTSLEFLDLSRNQFVGSIPSSLTQIDRLTMLDLSHNNLSGEIPIGTQLQSFHASNYEDNLDLCGQPLEKLCIDEDPMQKPIVKLHDAEYMLFGPEFFMSMAVGFVISFWGVLGSLLAKRSWRYAYFKFLNYLASTIYNSWLE